MTSTERVLVFYFIDLPWSFSRYKCINVMGGTYNTASPLYLFPPCVTALWHTIEARTHHGDQTSVNHGPNSRFVLESIIKAMISNLNSS